MLQKIIRVGNSLAVTLPKQFTDKANYRAGDTVSVDANHDLRAIYIRPKVYDDRPGLTPEFKQWLDDIVSQESDIIKALAKV
jgi:antitoxin component of MazEF toxin-antitoxin module